MRPSSLLRSVFGLLAFVLAAALVSPVFADVRLRIVAANLTSGNGQNYDLGHGARILQGLAPDVVLIQEFNYLSNTPANFRSWVDTYFGTSFSYVREPVAVQIPNGVISRYPILSSGAWTDANVGNRKFMWARIDIPGDKDLWAISVHFLTTSSSNRNAEAAQVLNYIAAQGIPASDYVTLGGDFNTDSRTESCLNTLSSYFTTSGPYPVDQSGNGGTNASRSKPYDWVLADADLHAVRTAVVLGSNTFTNGLVFDSRVYTPLPPPVLAGDSGATNMQHMAVVRDFIIPANNAPAIPAIYSATTASGVSGQAFNYQIAATNSPTSFNATGLPGGLSVNTTSGLISGTPAAAGNSTITLTATNTAGSGNATLALTVTAPSGGGGGGGGNGTVLLSEDFAAMIDGNDASNNGPSGTPLTTFPPNFPTCSLVYSAGGTAKFGNGSNPGSMTSRTLNLNSGGGAFTVSLKVKGWTTIEGNLTVTPSGLASQTIFITSNLTQGYQTKTLNFTGGTANSTITIATTAKRAFIDDVLVTVAAPAATPTLSANGTLTAVDTVYGDASPTPASLTVSGADLTAGILVTAPAGFEVSQTAGGASGYAATQTLAATSGTVAATTVYVRLAAATGAGSYFGNVVCTSAGAASVSIPVAPSAVGLRPLLITAQDRTKVFGTAFTAGTSAFNATGLVPGQTIGSVTLTAVGGAGLYDAAGVYDIVPANATGGTFLAANYSISYAPGVLSVTAPAFAEWAAGLADPSAGGDSDGDGVANLLEYFYGLDPAVADGFTPAVQTVSGGAALTFDYRRSKAAVGVTGTVEATTELAGTPVWATTDVVSDELITDFGPYETRRATVTVNSGETRKFVRLRVTAP